jgi:hypothetical protein
MAGLVTLGCERYVQYWSAPDAFKLSAAESGFDCFPLLCCCCYSCLLFQLVNFHMNSVTFTSKTWSAYSRIALVIALNINCSYCIELGPQVSKIFSLTRELRVLFPKFMIVLVSRF